VKNRYPHPKRNPNSAVKNLNFAAWLLLAFLLPSLGWGVVEETPVAVAEQITDLPIPDAGQGSLSHTITIPGSDPIEQIEVSFKIEHPAFEQLQITLVSPQKTILLHAQTPAPTNPYAPIYEITATAAEPLTSLLQTNPQGEWTLRVTDTQSGGTGRLWGWGLKIAPATVLMPPPPDPAPLPADPFTERARIPLPARISGGLAADLNHDGIADALLWSQENSQVILIPSDGHTLTDSLQTYEINKPQRLATGDLNRDGKTDFIAATSNAVQTIFTVFLANDEGTFTKGFTATVNTQLQTLALFDINQDTIPDLVLGGDPFYVLGGGDGAFQPAKPLILNNLGKGFWTHGDLNHDDVDDLLVSISRGGTSPNLDPHILWGGGNLESLDRTKLALKGDWVQAQPGIASRPGEPQFVVIADSGEPDPIWLFSTITPDLFGHVRVQQVRLAGDLLTPPLAPLDINQDGVDEWLYASPQGVMAFQRTNDIFGGRHGLVYPLQSPRVIIPGLYFADQSAGLVVTTSSDEVLLLQSNQGSQPTATPYASPTPTATPFLFLPTATPAATPTLVPTATPTPGPVTANPDLNGDGQINSHDLLLFMQHWKTENHP
jgi:subtilisin-like proprotein convertase family protein